jgi:hypothetical protein
MAKVAGLAVSTVQKIWKAHGLAPHRWRQFKLSNDPAFADKLNDVVGLYVRGLTERRALAARFDRGFDMPRKLRHAGGHSHQFADTLRRVIRPCHAAESIRDEHIAAKQGCRRRPMPFS